ncbi:MAG: hypothetical protein D6679_02635 [Candidatus Hydrogenedentota bacterium]|nr:MAG: hypothetical protein D6679_02635 [Candidatus Hydrogenedentota bacterium]
MFLKRHQRRKDGKTHSYWALTETVRTSKGPRHRTVAYLGESTPSERKGWAHLEQQPDDPVLKALHQASLFECENDKDTEEVPKLVHVRINGVRVEKTRDFGDVWLALSAWRALGLEKLFLNLIPEGKEEISWAYIVGIMVIGRVCSPGSERHTAQDWYPQTSLGDLLNLDSEQVYAQRLYRALDTVFPRKVRIEQHLKKRFGELLNAEYELVLYDITSTYFEGEAQSNELAQRGYSRDRRFDCKQVCIALMTTTGGLPFGYEAFRGEPK